MTNRRYLGDDIFVEVEERKSFGKILKLTCMHSTCCEVPSIIYLEAQVYDALVQYVEELDQDRREEND